MNASTFPSDHGDDGSTWWVALGLPAPAPSDSPHHCQTVILLGKPQSGKRTLCHRLTTAMASSLSQPTGPDGLHSPLYTAAVGKLFQFGEETTDHQAEQSGSPSKSTATRLSAGMNVTGVGVAHDFVLQRQPGLSSYAPASAGGPAGRRGVEFFSCDCAGALSIALPTLSSLESTVVLLVVDVSSGMKQQLDWCVEALHSRIRALLREFVPNEDEVRLEQLREASLQFWSAETERLAELRQSLQRSTAAGSGSVAGSVPASDVSVLRTVIVCTNVELLEQRSSSYASAAGECGEPLDAALRRGVENSGLPLAQLVSQLLRHYAITHRCALAAISNVVMETSGDELLHPFFKGLWGYIEYLLESSAVKSSNSRLGSRPPPECVAEFCRSTLFPSTLIPCGVDDVGFLHSFIAAETIAMPGVPPPVPERRNTLSLFPLHQDLLKNIVMERYLESIAAQRVATSEEAMVWDSV